MAQRPKVRAAKFGDIWGIYSIIVESHERSRYAKVCKVDEKRCKALLVQAIQRHGGTTEGATFVAVAAVEDRIEGFIIAVLQPLYLIGDVLEASDMFWVARIGAHGSTAGRLVKAMHKWVPPGVFVRQGITDIINDLALPGRLLEQHGMRLTGHIYEKRKETTP